jgi:hypothetical protein
VHCGIHPTEHGLNYLPKAYDKSGCFADIARATLVTKVLVRQYYYRACVETRAKGMKLYHHTRLTDRNTRNRQAVLFGKYQNIISNGPNGKDYLFLDQNIYTQVVFHSLHSLLFLWQDHPFVSTLLNSLLSDVLKQTR